MANEQFQVSKVPLSGELRKAAIIVDSSGNAETEESKIPQIVMHRETISPERPEAIVDLDTLDSSSSGEYAVYVFLYDFGIPPRTVQVSRLFEDKWNGEFTDVNITDETYNPIRLNKVRINCPLYGYGPTAIHVTGHDISEGIVSMEPGEHVTLGHDREPSDLRLGFINNEARAVVFDSSWDIKDIKEHATYYTPFLQIRYEGNIIVITGYDDANAEVIYEKKATQTDVVAGDETGDKTREQVLETILARIKSRLIKTNEELQNALFENMKLKKETKERPFQSPFIRILNASAEDPYGYCKTLGIDPDLLSSRSPKDAEKIVLGIRRNYASIYHPDKGDVDPEELMKINAATDKILERIKTGYWGRS
ncbi:MAG: hypothetical protein A2W22_00125 [Candidatus Levybacteria bacterium RBG_16_35_11]|nr:MAG: hypothetical protein A2W22_00125 [Candidatus Levybacteria bacterium RBG_16_35_11]